MCAHAIRAAASSKRYGPKRRYGLEIKIVRCDAKDARANETCSVRRLIVVGDVDDVVVAVPKRSHGGGGYARPPPTNGSGATPSVVGFGGASLGAAVARTPFVAAAPPFSAVRIVLYRVLLYIIIIIIFICIVFIIIIIPTLFLYVFSFFL